MSTELTTVGSMPGDGIAVDNAVNSRPPDSVNSNSPADTPPANTPPANTPPANTPPADTPTADSEPSDETHEDATPAEVAPGETPSDNSAPSAPQVILSPWSLPTHTPYPPSPPPAYEAASPGKENGRMIGI